MEGFKDGLNPLWINYRHLTLALQEVDSAHQTNGHRVKQQQLQSMRHTPLEKATVIADVKLIRFFACFTGLVHGRIHSYFS